MLIDSEKLKELIKEKIENIKDYDVMEIAKPGIVGGLKLAILDIENLEKESKLEE